MEPRGAGPPCRVLLLGASNLAVLLPGVVETLAISLAGRDASIFAAKGPGRGYCREGGYLRRRYPPLLECGILEEFLAEHHREPGPAAGVILDAGNDLLYGASPREVEEAVGTLTRGLLSAGVVVTVVLPPVLPVLSLSPLAFRVLRSILFPTRSLSVEEARLGIVDLADAMARLAHHGACLDRELSRLVGIDRIHVAATRLGPAAALLAGTLLAAIPGAAPPVELTMLRVLGALRRWGRLSPRRMTIGPRIRETEGRHPLGPGLELRLY